MPLRSRLCSAGMDVELRHLRAFSAVAATVQTPLFDEDRVAAVSTRSPFAGEDVIDWLELAAGPLVVNTVYGTT